ncbi:hypothetical protein RSAG8_09528, partial [Rhizoctonia solani AG-8 WAC10335]
MVEILAASKHSGTSLDQFPSDHTVTFERLTQPPQAAAGDGP